MNNTKQMIRSNYFENIEDENKKLDKIEKKIQKIYQALDKEVDNLELIKAELEEKYNIKQRLTEQLKGGKNTFNDLTQCNIDIMELEKKIAVVETSVEDYKIACNNQAVAVIKAYIEERNERFKEANNIARGIAKEVAIYNARAWKLIDTIRELEKDYSKIEYRVVGMVRGYDIAIPNFDINNYNSYKTQCSLQPHIMDGCSNKPIETMGWSYNDKGYYLLEESEGAEEAQAPGEL